MEGPELVEVDVVDLEEDLKDGTTMDETEAAEMDDMEETGEGNGPTGNVRSVVKQATDRLPASQ